MDTYIEKACEQFRTLLLEQLARTEQMETGSTPKDFGKLEKITIGIVGGDGIYCDYFKAFDLVVPNTVPTTPTNHPPELFDFDE